MRQAMTEAELRLWVHLRKPGNPHLRFRRQTPIGPYIVDVFCPQHRLIVEVDGAQHATRRNASDRLRDTWLRQQGYTVLRVGNRDVMTNLDGVYAAILGAVDLCDPPPGIASRFSTSPQGGGSTKPFGLKARVKCATPS
jgi:very-short-patch-repair endonuclease